MSNSVYSNVLYTYPQFYFRASFDRVFLAKKAKMSINKEVERMYNYKVWNIKYAKTIFKFPETLAFTEGSELHRLNLQVYKVSHHLKTMTVLG